jgi:hypothetical protein
MQGMHAMAGMGGISPYYYNNPMTPIIYGFNPYEMDAS